MDTTTLTIKLVIFSIVTGKLHLYLPANRLPSGSIKNKETLEQAEARIFNEHFGLKEAPSHHEQLYTFSGSRSGKISLVIAYYILVSENALKKINRKDWHQVTTIASLQESEIILYALKRLRWKIEYTNVVYALLPQEFSLSQLQSTYEAILNKPLDKRNFRKKILSLGLLEKSDRKLKGRIARPAQMYRFKTTEPFIVEIFRS